MQNKQKNILIFVLALAGLLVGMLYTPIVSPDLYYSSTFYPQNNNVVMNGGQIPNAPKSYQVADNEEIVIPDYNNPEVGMGSHVGSYSTSESFSSRTSTVSKSESGSMYSPSSVGSSSNSGSMLAGYMASARYHGSAASSTIQMSDGVVSISSDLATTSTTPKENTLSGPSAGGTDPGGDPTSPPIPVGDGFVFLMLLAAIFALYKRNVKKQIDIKAL